jgi:Holliday junction resolvase RusA-like endonuclease
MTISRSSLPISLTLPISPRSIQFSGKRVMVRAGRPVFFKNKQAVGFQSQVASYAASSAPPELLTCPISLSVVFVVQRPKALGGKRHPAGRIPAVKRPDLDNLVKGLLDAIKGYWVDDSQIVSMQLQKHYAAKEEKPHIHITIDEYRAEPS